MRALAVVAITALLVTATVAPLAMDDGNKLNQYNATASPSESFSCD
jgi:hypothetical protein